jgi:hypothetical protein
MVVGLHIQGYNGVESRETFRGNTSPPSSGLKSKLSKKQVRRIWQVLDIKDTDFHTACFMLVSCLAYLSTLKMEATYFSGSFG